MSEPTQYFRTHAEFLMRDLGSNDTNRRAGALTRIRRALPSTRTMSEQAVIATMRHSNALEVIAHEQGYANWADMAAGRAPVRGEPEASPSFPVSIEADDFATASQVVAGLAENVPREWFAQSGGIEAVDSEGVVWSVGLQATFSRLDPQPAHDSGGESDGSVDEGPRVLARFQPQQWINDEAIDSDPPIEFDVTSRIKSMPRARALSIRDNSDASDDLVPTSLLRRHGGPFRVLVEDAIREYFDAYDAEARPFTLSLDFKGELAAAVTVEAISEEDADDQVMKAVEEGRVPWHDNAGRTHHLPLSSHEVTVDWIAEEDTGEGLSAVPILPRRSATTPPAAESSVAPDLEALDAVRLAEEGQLDRQDALLVVAADLRYHGHDIDPAARGTRLLDIVEETYASRMSHAASCTSRHGAGECDCLRSLVARTLAVFGREV
jgi:hypothetical protein